MKTLVTHSGSFHQDELFAIATLLLIFGDEIKIVRTRDTDLIQKADYAIDVSGINDPKKGRFDHHQEGGAGQRANGIPYASFGLVWKEYGHKLTKDPRVADIVDKKLVQPIDAADNGVALFSPVREGVYPYLFNNVLSALTPTWRDSANVDDTFTELLPLIKVIVLKEIEKADYFFRDLEEVRTAYTQARDKRIILLEHPYPWKSTLGKFKEPMLVIHPDQNTGEWVIACVPNDTAKGFSYRILFPIEWRGRMRADLAKISDIKDAEFCHKNGFIAKAWSKEGAVKMAEKVLRGGV